MTRAGQRAPRLQPVVRDGRRSLAEQLYDSVKRDIVEHRLPPDTILVEGALAERYGVSRAPAREALKHLATVGFVRVVPRVGYIVTSVSVRDFDEIFALRLVLEPLAVELAVPHLDAAADERLERLAGHVVALAAAGDGELHLLAEVNTDFHCEIAAVAGNSHLERTITGLHDELERFMHMLALSDAVSTLLDEHMSLLEAMRRGDPVPAAALMREQLVNDYTTMRRVILRDAAAVTLGSGAMPA
jgi:DNA-binding GntR family transcriptional regulator